VTWWYPLGTEQFVWDQTWAGVANPRGVPHKPAQSSGNSLVVWYGKGGTRKPLYSRCLYDRFRKAKKERERAKKKESTLSFFCSFSLSFFAFVNLLFFAKKEREKEQKKGNNTLPELRLLTLASRPGYPGCTTRRWSWLWVWEAIRQSRAFKQPTEPNGLTFRKLHINTPLHPPQKNWTVETLDVLMGHSLEIGYSNLCLIPD